MDRHYFVKQDIGLFKRNGDWTLALGRQMIGMYPDRETAVTTAVDEARRTSMLGSATEVWVNDGHGFLLVKAFKATKPSAEEEEEEEEKPDDDVTDFA